MQFDKIRQCKMERKYLTRVLIVQQVDSTLFLNFTNFASIIRRGTSRIFGVEWGDFLPSIIIKYSFDHPHRRDTRVFISILDRRQIESSQTLVVNNHLRLITLLYATLEWQPRPRYAHFSSPFIFFTFFSLWLFGMTIKCDWKRVIKCDAMRYSI